MGKTFLVVEFGVCMDRVTDVNERLCLCINRRTGPLLEFATLVGVHGG